MHANREQRREGFGPALPRAFRKEGAHREAEQQAGEETAQHELRRAMSRAQRFGHDVQQAHRDQHAAGRQRKQAGLARRPFAAQRHGGEPQRCHDSGEQAKGYGGL